MQLLAAPALHPHALGGVRRYGVYDGAMDCMTTVIAANSKNGGISALYSGIVISVIGIVRLYLINPSLLPKSSGMI